MSTVTYATQVKQIKGYIVTLKKGVDVDKVSRDIKAKHNVEIGHKYRKTLNGFSFKGSENALQAIQRHMDVERIEEDGIVKAVKGPNKSGGKPEFQQPSQIVPEGVTRVNGLVPADENTGSVWVIDSGIDLDHPDLNVDIARSASFLLGGKNAQSPDDKNGHGTHVAGTIAAIDNDIGVVGVVPNAKVISVRVLDRNGSGSTSGVIAGIEHVATYGQPGDVANMSLGGSASLALDNAVINAASTGIIFVLAAGNESNDANLYSPARANGENIYTISAVDHQDVFAYFSNYGNPPIDYAAPGVSILSTYLNGEYRTFSGTSMAAPHAAGVLLVTKAKGIEPTICGNAIDDKDLTPDPLICIPNN